jgi:hypothetical protein
MNTNSGTVGALLLFNVFVCSVLTSQALGDEAISKFETPTYSSSERTMVRATIVERLSFSCDYFLPAAAVEITAFPPLAEDYFRCSYLKNMLSGTFEMTLVDMVTRWRGFAAPFITVSVSANSSTSSGTAAPSTYQYIIEVIYNSE